MNGKKRRQRGKEKQVKKQEGKCGCVLIGQGWHVGLWEYRGACRIQNNVGDLGQHLGVGHSEKTWH